MTYHCIYHSTKEVGGLFTKAGLIRFDVAQLMIFLVGALYSHQGHKLVNKVIIQNLYFVHFSVNVGGASPVPHRVRPLVTPNLLTLIGLSHHLISSQSLSSLLLGMLYYFFEKVISWS